MESDDSSIDIKCENMMNIVVESRKRFGKMCVDYETKTSLMENKILKLNIETFSNYKFKPKNPVSNVSAEGSTEIEEFSLELSNISKRFEDIQRKVKNTQEVICQLAGKAGDIEKRLRDPLTAEVILAKHKSKNVA